MLRASGKTDDSLTMCLASDYVLGFLVAFALNKMAVGEWKLLGLFILKITRRQLRFLLSQNQLRRPFQ